jgi:hypothetical protein
MYVVKLVTKVPIVEIDQGKDIHVLLVEEVEALLQEHLVMVITVVIVRSLKGLVILAISPDIMLLIVEREKQGNTNQEAAEITLCAVDFNLEEVEWEIGANFDMIDGELACLAEEDMQLEFGYCINCDSRGPIGTFCVRCIDPGCIYAAERLEDEGPGEYWENSNDKD